MARELPKRPGPVGARSMVLLAIVAGGLGAGLAIGLFTEPASLGEAGPSSSGRFLSRALSPALVSEDPGFADPPSLLPDVLHGIRRTIVFAAASLGIALPLGFLLALLASTAWWRRDGGVGGGRARRATGIFVYSLIRPFIALLRSVHELLWAVLLLSAMGRSDVAAVLALAIPFTGTAAKVFSEMIDEAPREAALALRAGGAGSAQVFFFGYLPRALPDMTAYAMYQFECALRSSAVLGFFGIQTLGYYIRAAFQNHHYGEVWTYLYALLFLLLVAEWWSGTLRKRFVA